jgi:hypothetical protein
MRFRIGFRLLAALTLVAGLAQAARAEVTVQQILGYKPAQQVEVTTPAAGEAATCTLDLEKFKALPGGKEPTAWVVKDAKGTVLRKFHDTVGGGGVNMFAYYKDGEEVYREMVGKNGKVDQYRWLGSAGSKWGIDLDGDGKIDTWLVISPEELSQELLNAIISKNAKRLQSLMLNQNDIETLGLPATEVDRISKKMAGAGAEFQKLTKELGLTDKAIWVHLETRTPHTAAADAIGAKADFVRYRHGTILYQEGDGKEAKHNWLQTGELIQVGKAWRITQAPTVGMEPPPGTVSTGTQDGPGSVTVPESAKDTIKLLDDLDKQGPKPGRQGAVDYNLSRAKLLEQIVAQFKKVEERANRDVWLKQVADCYATAAQQGDKGAMDRLTLWRKALEGDPKSAALPYFLFREVSGEYGQRLPKEGDNIEKLNKLQEWWKDKLTKFVADYANVEDTPDAILQLGQVNEYFGSKAEADAKAAYALLIKNFPGHPLAKRAQGCLDRLSLEGSKMKLAAPTIGGGQFNVDALAGKAVVVYYWASWNELAANDFNKIKAAMKDYAGKAELVGVNLDNKAEDATGFIKSNGVPGTHLFQPGGLESPLAVQYGITALPVMFVVGPDGKVVTRHAQASTLDDELKKVFKTPEKEK